MNILLLSSGGGGGNILRSLKTLFAKDVATAQKADAKFAEQLRRAITTRFLDTNEFSLAHVPKEERVLIGAATTHRLGSRHSPELAQRALQESQGEVERLIAKHSVIVLIATGGKGTGAGTMFPLAQLARQQKKLLLPVFVRPSFERHEVDKRRYDHAIHVAEQFDAARIRLIEILNDRAYCDSDPQPQAVVWERMNLPIARGLRGLLYVLWDLSQVDPSDLSILLAGDGRMRIGFAELSPPQTGDPTDTEIAEAVRGCWQNTYCAFSKPVGTSLVCIQGDWSNLADAKIKGGIAALALGDAPGRPYNPLYARAFQTPRPWGVTALFTEHTGVHEPLVLDWNVRASAAAFRQPPNGPTTVELVEPAPAQATTAVPPNAADVQPVSSIAAEPHAVSRSTSFDTVWDFARALNRGDRAALEAAADERQPEMPIDGLEVKRLLGTIWFRGVFTHLSATWKERLLAALAESVVMPNHVLRNGRQAVHLKELRYEQLKEISATTLLRGAAGTDLQLLLAIGNLWGEHALSRLQFADTTEHEDSSRLASLLGLRG